ncbi:MAG TPA: rhombosortase [Planctomycetota bacterium]
MLAPNLSAVACTAALAAFAAVAAWPPLAGALVLERSRLSAEPWRLLTGHWTHWSADHLIWNVLVFGALGALMELRSRARFLACIVVSALAISAALVVLQPQVAHYRGLSGIDSALFAAVVVALLHDALAAGRWRTASCLVLAFAGLLAKIVFESTTGRLLFVDAAAFTSVPLVHAVGAMVGVVIALVPVPGRARAAAQARERDRFVPAVSASRTSQAS